MNYIKLNFLELNNQNCQFSIFRKRSQERQDSPYFGRLPLNEDENAEYNSYQIRLIKHEGFEEFRYKLKYNNDFSCRLLFDKLVEATGSDTNFEYEIKDGFLKSLELCIEEVPQGKKVIIFSSYILKEHSKFGFLIDYRFREKEGISNKKEVQRLSLSLDSTYRSNRNFYKDKYQLISSIIHKIPDLNIQGKRLAVKKSLLEIESNQLKKKTYIFKNGNIGNSQFQGIKNYGPYKEIPNDKKLKFYFIFRDKYKNLANDIYLGLIGKYSPGTFPGFKSMFKVLIEKDNVNRIDLKAPDKDSSKKAIQEVIGNVAANPIFQPFVIYIEDNNHEDVQQDLYYLMKLEFLKKSIPIQVLNSEKIGSRETLKWSISSIALQIFAKLGGIPWLVKPSEKNCLILGIGQAYEKVPETGIRKQFAYSVCVDSSGLYKKIEILSREEEDQDFYQTIKESIINLLKDEEFSDYKKCAIHVPFKMSNRIISSLKEIASYIQDTEVRVIKVNTKNKYFGFTDHNTRVPYESSYIKLNSGEYLVWFEGLNFGKEIVYKRIGNPIHIEFLDSSDFSLESELNYLQDILNLSGSNWRGFNTKAKPISIYYSELVADYSVALQKLDGFDSSVFVQHAPWFL